MYLTQILIRVSLKHIKVGLYEYKNSWEELLACFPFIRYETHYKRKN
jgi:hypothetical protein